MSTPLTIGVEEEYLLVDAVTRRPMPVGADIAPGLSDVDFQCEFAPAQAEFVSPVCPDLDTVCRELVRGRRTLATAALSRGALLLATGTPPLGRPGPPPVTGKPRYLRMAEHFGALADDQGVCGCHVHVGVPDTEHAIRASNHIRPWLPALLLLSANSPFFNGRDTGHASWRTNVWSREPITVLFTLALPPLVLYALAQVFGNTPDPTGRVYGGVGPLDFYVPAYVGLVIASLGLIGLPVHIASYRERGVLRRFQAARVPASAVVLAQLGTVFAAVLAGGAILVALARLSYDVRWPASWWAVSLTVVVGTLAFAAIGVFLGALLPTARAAQGIGVLLWFLMLMISGGGPPPEVLSSALRRIGDFTPLQHLRIALQDAWLGRGVNWTQVLILLAVMVACAGLATPALRRRG